MLHQVIIKHGWSYMQALSLHQCVLEGLQCQCITTMHHRSPLPLLPQPSTACSLQWVLQNTL